MPAWISNSFKVLSSIVMNVVTMLALLIAVIYTLATGFSLMKGGLVLGLLAVWLLSFICIARKVYSYLFGVWKDDDE
ncbi:hypothetical protein SAMN04487936_11443 [Halobacillus dabanensis]|uniref:Uncharacterized protein n=1 Tax=Halobacillus dabanensis TaxID=240302 RepID=A0A1I3ZME4_HALDA|nr:hypothetical protein [Halobacillus dabanensis]SFK45120.1 hypothetical protein SAMN04487936_11443 [Halobacillus dabanensis]